MIAQSENEEQINLGIPEENKIGIYQGMLMKGRGIGQLIKSIKEIENFTLIIVGDGHILNELKDLAAGLNIMNKVVFCGAVPFQDLYKYTRLADFGFTIISGTGLSYYHALPNKLFEYIQSGIPVIGSNYPEIKKIINSEDIGYTVNPHSVEEISSAIGKMLIPENYSQFKQQAERIRFKYTWENESKKYLDIIRLALK